jgi:REP element-mobilizing transposase RayT
MNMESRMKIRGEGCYYHLYNRIGCCKGEHPFSEIDKEYGFRLLQNLCDYFLIEVISAAWMGNHFHLVVYAPGPEELPPLESIVKRHNNYYKSMTKISKFGPRNPVISLENKHQCKEIALKMIDISRFMSAYQRRFTCVYNETRDRTGQLWGRRFKSTILDKINALAACVIYVELNPVRASLKKDPAEYSFSTWGRYCKSGRHMFYGNFVKHMKPNITTGDTSQWTDKELFAFFRGELARIIAAESGASSEEIYAARDKARRQESMHVLFLRRTRHFTDGVILGSKIFIRETGSCFDNPERMRKKQLSRGHSPSGAALYCFRKLINSP